MKNSRRFTSIVNLLPIALTFTVAVALSGPARGVTQNGELQSDLKERLINAVNAELPATEVLMTDNAVRDLEFFVSKAADKLRDDSADETKINEATQKAKELGQGLRAHGIRRSDGRVLIDRSVIAGIRDWFCPCYPFCN
jgi:hypothetical protein